MLSMLKTGSKKSNRACPKLNGKSFKEASAATGAVLKMASAGKDPGTTEGPQRFLSSMNECPAPRSYLLCAQRRNTMLSG